MNHKCNIFNIKNYNLEIYYTYNPYTTFADLSEFICSLYPKTFCPCFKFKYNENDKYFTIQDENKIISCENYIKCLYFKKDNKNCQCNPEFRESMKYFKIDLYKEKKVLEDKLRELVSIIDKLKSENIILKEKNKEMKKYFENEYNIEEINNQLKIEKKILGDIKIDNQGKIVTNEKAKNINATDFYDAVISINSIKDINKGWEVKMSKRLLEKYEEFKKGNVVKIGVIGNSNKGKSFLLSKISGINLPFGTSIRTEGLSIKYPEIEENKNRKIVLLDSAGFETPVLKIDEKSKQQIEKEETNNIISEYELFTEKSRDKIITEIFLQNYIIHNSDILLLVVGVLTYSEQKLLNKVKTEIKRANLKKTLYVIHNLKTYTSVEQVQNYIKDILLNCATFDLEKLQKISTKKEINDGDIYYEKNSNPPVYHLIFANEGSEAGKYYNNYSLQYIEDTYKFLRDLESFDIIKTVKDRFKEVAKDIIEKTEKELKFDNNINNSDNSNNKIIKLYQPENIILKKCFMDELGFSNFKANGLEPKYNYYKKDDQIIIRIELPGNCYIESSKDYIGKYTVIKINGIKSKDKEPEEIEQNIFNTRENGNFYLEILLKTEEYLIKNEEPKIEEKKGIFILSYKLDEKTDKVSKYKLKEEEEI
jgi:uncharacterized protein YerC